MLLKIPRLYDSHTHFIATGEFSSGLNLNSLAKAQDLALKNLQNPDFQRGDWLMGFGWDDSLWPEPPHKNILDAILPDRPAFLSRIDGHSSWVNSAALKVLGISSETGILTEKDHLRAWDHLPDFTKSQQRRHVFSACKEYNRGGFTHVRDMSCSESLWNLLFEMSESRELTVAIEQNYTTHDLQDFDKMLRLCLEAKKHQTSFLRMKGIKLFFDGSLGSETAFLSKPYNGQSRGPCGKALWDLNDVEEVLQRTWQAGLEFSVHVIGDEAAHQIVKLARKVSAAGYVGRLNLEHAQVLRAETIQMMKPLHVRCHMQPCHWLSDKKWLQHKLGELYANVFPWEALRLAKIPISFGCDSPVEPPSFLRNKLALEESVSAGIKMFGGDLATVHSHPDPTFADSYTLIEDGQIREIYFAGQQISLDS